MKTRFVAGLVMVGAGLLWAGSADAQWGTIRGRIVVDGDVPKPANLVAGKPGLPPIPDESVVIDPKSKGLANAVIWLSRKPDRIHPGLVVPAVPQVDVGHQGYRLVPHVLLARTDQKVRVLSADPVVHNVHTHAVKNAQQNFLIQPNDRQGVVVSMPIAERLPIKVGSDTYPWMQGWWMILDHPYATVTNEKGEFEIADLPVGEHDFKIWQEKVGYLERVWRITVAEGENRLPSLTYPVSQFK